MTDHKLPEGIPSLASPEVPGQPYQYRAVLWFFGLDGGQQPGAFAGSLLSSLSHADLTNRAILAEAFPAWGVPFVLAKDAPGGVSALGIAALHEEQTGRYLGRDALAMLAGAVR